MKSIEGISIFTQRPVRVVYDGRQIAEVLEIQDRPNLPYISPGFLDMQVNGFQGIDYSLENLEGNQIETLVKYLGRTGTTRHVPTFVSMPQDRLLRNLRITCEAMHSYPIVDSALVGFHIEGPFISTEDGPRGAHDRKFVRKASFDEFQEWQSVAEGKIKYITLAPEVDGAIDLIHSVVQTGVKVAIGHTGASPEQIQEAIAAGATQSTHLGNGSYTTLPRLRNYIWEQLAADTLSAGIICDGYHLPRSVVKVFARAKQLERIILVSDVALLGGYPPGLYKWGNLDVQVFDDGHLGLPGTTVLAGAAHALDCDIARFMEFTGTPLAQTIALCTANPARYVGLPIDRYSSFKVGGAADFCVFSYQKGASRLLIEKAILDGVDLS